MDIVESRDLEAPLRGASSGARRFSWLMPRRVSRILLVSSPYDQYLLETEGALSQQLVNHYLDLNLGYPPHIDRVATPERALERLGSESFDLVVKIARVEATDAEFGSRVKSVYPEVPVMLVAQHTAGLTGALRARDFSHLDGVFVWTGDASLLMSMALSLEDRMNAAHDTAAGSVRVIILVEDSPFFYSNYLPLLYRELVNQTRAVVEDSVNPSERLLRQRARPRVLLATTFEEAAELHWQYSNYLLGCITDVCIPRDGRRDDQAGVELARSLQRTNPTVPVLIHSSDEAARAMAVEAGAEFVNKHDIDLLARMREFVRTRFGFGDFTFTTPDARVLGRAASLSQMAEELARVPDDCLRYHASRGHFSTWLRARTEFETADCLAPLNLSSFPSIDATREFLVGTFRGLDERRQTVELVDFDRAGTAARIMRIGSGSLGGKARGLAFANQLIHHSGLDHRFANLPVSIPRTAVLTTEVFDELDRNGEVSDIVARTEPDDEWIAEYVQRRPVPLRLLHNLRRALQMFGPVPLAVRSSSLLEDALFVRSPASTSPR